MAADKGVDLDKLSLAEMQAVEPRIDRGVYRVLTVEASVKARKSLRRHRAGQRRARREGGAPPLPGTQGPMSFFAYKNGEMHAEGVALADHRRRRSARRSTATRRRPARGWQEFADGMKGMNA